MAEKPLTVAWFSYFPIEWLPDLPEPLRNLPRQHPATWQSVLLDQLEKLPHLRLHILALRKQFPNNFRFQRGNVTFHCLKTVGGLRAPSFYWLDTWLIQRALQPIQPDLVHAWGTEHGAALVASRLKYPAVVTMQGLMNWLTELMPVSHYVRFAALLEGWSLRRASVVTAESNFAVQYLHRHYPRLELHQVEHAPNPLFHQVARRPQLRPLRFVFVGSFSQGKGADILLRALDQLVSDLNFELRVIGSVDAGFLASFKAELSPALWERAGFRDNLTSREVSDELSTATMLLYPTRADNSPNAVKEAVVAGVPVVASAIGGIVDYVIPGGNGLLSPAGDLRGFVQAIQQACAHPQFGQGLVDLDTLHKMRAYLSPEQMGQRFLGVYRRVLSRKQA